MKNMVEGIDMKKVVITVIGRDTIGIIAKVCSLLAENKVNILDISQTIVSGFFNMMMITDISRATISFEELCTQLDEVGSKIGVVIKAQQETIFDMMHRI